MKKSVRGNESVEFSMANEQAVRPAPTTRRDFMAENKNNLAQAYGPPP
jgi:hypothetical protein